MDYPDKDCYPKYIGLLDEYINKANEQLNIIQNAARESVSFPWDDPDTCRKVSLLFKACDSIQQELEKLHGEIYVLWSDYELSIGRVDTRPKY